jgi:hypothetical protein
MLLDVGSDLKWTREQHRKRPRLADITHDEAMGAGWTADRLERGAAMRLVRRVKDLQQLGLQQVLGR